MMGSEELIATIIHALRQDDGGGIMSVDRIVGEPAIGVEMGDGDFYFVTIDTA